MYWKAKGRQLRLPTLYFSPPFLRRAPHLSFGKLASRWYVRGVTFLLLRFPQFRFLIFLNVKLLWFLRAASYPSNKLHCLRRLLTYHCTRYLLYSHMQRLSCQSWVLSLPSKSAARAVAFLCLRSSRPVDGLRKLLQFHGSVVSDCMLINSRHLPWAPCLNDHLSSGYSPTCLASRYLAE